MKHSFQSGIADGGDASVVRPSNWNAVHSRGIDSVSGNLSLDESHDLILATGGAGGIAITLANAALCDGRQHTIKRVDSGAGDVTIDTAGGNIDANSTYVLSNQFAYVTVVSDGANWLVVAAGF